MQDSSINLLLEDLKNSDEKVRQQATEELWRRWFYQKGAYGWEVLQESQVLLMAGKTTEAEKLLTELIKDQPDFVEAWNRRAVFYYVIGDYEKSLDDCQIVVKLNPIHFGALHGMGLCHAALENYTDAIQAFRKALSIQPYALENQRLILECTARLS